MQKKNWIRFETETGLKGGYVIENGEAVIKLLSSVPKGYYWSCVNEIGVHFEEHIQPSLTVAI